MRIRFVISIMCVLLAGCWKAAAQTAPTPSDPDSGVDSIKAALERRHALPATVGDARQDVPEPENGKVNPHLAMDTLLPSDKMMATDQNIWVERPMAFSPDPKRAVWLSALFPGLGQIYNRRYWKLPILVGGYLGLAYATNWNATMLRDYTRAYADIMDNDPSTKSYMDFFPPTIKEENLDRTWLTNLLKNRKDYFRRNRDLCIICIVGVYLVAMVDAYVDASLAHFDISPDLSIDWAPAVIPDARGKFPSVGLQWAFNF